MSTLIESPRPDSRAPGHADRPPSPELFFQTLNAFQRTAALKAALDLDLFTAIADGAQTPEAVASTCDASVRGTRILCDYLVVLGFLTKEGDGYRLTQDSLLFLNRHSPAYAGRAADFLLAPENMAPFADFAAVVRRGSGDPTLLVPDSARWVNFARSMAPMMALPAELLADLLDVAHMGPIRVLDIAAGHGLFGITIARHNPQARIVAVDWAPVLEVARENARAAGVGDRYQTLVGDAMAVELGRGFDLVLLTNILHHFDRPTCVTFLRKIHGAMRDGARVAALEFVPDENRVTPPAAAAFAVTMLAITPSGDAYTFSDLQGMFREAGLGGATLHELPPSPERVVTATR
jgi:hypothetical protein